MLQDVDGHDLPEVTIILDGKSTINRAGEDPHGHGQPLKMEAKSDENGPKSGKVSFKIEDDKETEVGNPVQSTSSVDYDTKKRRTVRRGRMQVRHDTIFQHDRRV